MIHMTKEEAIAAALTCLADSVYTEKDVLRATAEDWSKLSHGARQGRVWSISFHQNNDSYIECNTAIAVVYVDDITGEGILLQDLVNEIFSDGNSEDFDQANSN